MTCIQASFFFYVSINVCILIIFESEFNQILFESCPAPSIPYWLRGDRREFSTLMRRYLLCLSIYYEPVKSHFRHWVHCPHNLILGVLDQI